MSKEPIPPVKTISLLIDGTTTLAVASTGTAYTKAIQLQSRKSFGIVFNITSSGTVTVKAEIEQGKVLPTTQGSADATNYNVGLETSSTISSDLATTGLRFLAFSPIVSPYIRVKLTGSGSNHASTTMTVDLFTIDNA